jgi:hypothetical protein
VIDASLRGGQQQGGFGRIALGLVRDTVADRVGQRRVVAQDADLQNAIDQASLRVVLLPAFLPPRIWT